MKVRARTLRKRVRLAAVVAAAILTFLLLALATEWVLPPAARWAIKNALAPHGLELSAETVDVRVRGSKIVLTGVDLSRAGAVLGRVTRVVLTLDPLALNQGIRATRIVQIRDGALDLGAISTFLFSLDDATRTAPFRTLSSVHVERVALSPPIPAPGTSVSLSARTSAEASAGIGIVVDALDLRGLTKFGPDHPAHMHGQLRIGQHGRVNIEGKVSAQTPALRGSFSTIDFPLAEFRAHLAQWGLGEAAGALRAAGSYIAWVEPTDTGSAIAIDLAVKGGSRRLESNLGAQIRGAGAFSGEGDIRLRGLASSGSGGDPFAQFEGTISAHELTLNRDGGQLDCSIANATWTGTIEGLPSLRYDGRVTVPYLQLTREKGESKTFIAVTNANLGAKGDPLKARAFTASTFSADGVDFRDERMTARFERVEATQLYAGFDGEFAVDELLVDRSQLRQASLGHDEGAELQLTRLALEGVDYRATRGLRAEELSAARTHYQRSEVDADIDSWQARSLVIGQTVRLAWGSGTGTALAAQPWGELSTDTVTVTGFELAGEATVDELDADGVRYFARGRNAASRAGATRPGPRDDINRGNLPTPGPVGSQRVTTPDATALLRNVSAGGVNFANEGLAFASAQGRLVMPSRSAGMSPPLRTGFIVSAGRFDFAKHRLDVQDMTLDKPLVGLALDVEGRWHLPGHEFPARATEANPGQTGAEGPTGTIANLRIDGAGRLRFTDYRFVRPVQFTLEGFRGDVSNLHTQPNEPTHFAFRGTGENGARASVVGTISDPGAAVIEGELMASRWALEDLSAYAERYLGLQLTGGHGALKLSFSLAPNGLQGALGLSMNQPSFEPLDADPSDVEAHSRRTWADASDTNVNRLEPVEEGSPGYSTGMRTATVLRLLQDHRGVAQLDIPLSGSISHPVLGLNSALSNIVVAAAGEIGTAVFGVKPAAATAHRTK